MAYAIRFRPIDSRDVSPALYMAQARGVRLTALGVDIFKGHSARGSLAVAASKSVQRRCRREHLIADVVTLADALADLEAP